MATAKAVFTQASLNGDNQYVWTHNLNTKDFTGFTWFDENDIEIGTEGAIQTTDLNTITLSCNAPITGSHRLLAQYDSGTAIITGKKLFGQTEGVPTDTGRFAFAESGGLAQNITYEDLKAGFAADSGSLLQVNNLSDLESASTARGNMGVYSIAQLDALLADKATLLGSGLALGTTNTENYTPATYYNPATKGYVDDLTPAVTATIDYTGKAPGLVVVELAVKSFASVVMISAYLEVPLISTNSWQLIGTINESDLHPAAGRYGTAAPFDSAANYGGAVRVDSSGGIYIATGSNPSSETWYFGLTYIR